MANRLRTVIQGLASAYAKEWIQVISSDPEQNIEKKKAYQSACPKTFTYSLSPERP
ncbi:hypothetical protein [Halobacillus dabanensis]|uniref:hypothetical protein n=1 Tax=Halobacillus dabanensis TaxID=240302 RepID=UPI001428A9FF|nr:hypothetical protein [Halobacillus dabanensis]